MNDEIKEILGYLKDEDDYIEDLGINYKRIHIDNGDLKTLLDYITNLQQDNEMYAQLKDEYEEEIKDLQQNYNRIYNEDCKLREEHNITDISLLDENYKLQQENERLKKDVELFKSDLISSTNTGLSLITKIDKAIEYIQNNMQYDDNIDDNWVMTKELLNILQGEDNENI